MSKQLIALLAIASIVSTVSAQPSESLSIAIELVRAARHDEDSMDIFKLVIRQAAEKGGYSRRTSDCINQQHYSAITIPIARHLEMMLTSDELKAALEFYRGSSGIKFRQSARVRFAREQGLVTEEDSPRFTPEEQAAAKAFYATSAGEKLIRRNEFAKAFTSEPYKQLRSEMLEKCIAAN